MEEIWKDIPGYEDEYQASSLGRIRSLPRKVAHFQTPIKTRRIKGKIRKFQISNSGYYSVMLSDKKRIYVHRLVAETFLENKEKLPCINHKDCNKLNNKIENLEFCSYAYNCNYADHNEKMRNTALERLGQRKDTKRIKCVETGEIFVSIRSAYRKYGFTHSNIIRACKTNTTYKGYHWQYVEQEKKLTKK